MENWENILTIAEVACLVLASILILMQNRGAGLSGTFGGSNQIYITRRGIERWVVTFTVVFIVIFVALRIISLYIVPTN
jgi:protein translocase SecG subunit